MTCFWEHFGSRFFCFLYFKHFSICIFVLALVILVVECDVSVCERFHERKRKRHWRKNVYNSISFSLKVVLRLPPLLLLLIFHSLLFSYPQENQDLYLYCMLFGVTTLKCIPKVGIPSYGILPKIPAQLWHTEATERIRLGFYNKLIR